MVAWVVFDCSGFELICPCCCCAMVVGAGKLDSGVVKLSCNWSRLFFSFHIV